MTTHIWVCVDDPKTYWKINVDDKTWQTYPEIEKEITEKMTTMVVGDHKHIFVPSYNPRRSVVVHECPGLEPVMTTLILGGER